MTMYRYVGSDGKWYPADLNRLKEWARQGYIEPYAPVLETATGKQTRADTLPELQPIFAARFEALSRQNAAAANVPPRAPLHKRPWAVPIMAGSVLAFVLLVWVVTLPERALSPAGNPAASIAPAPVSPASTVAPTVKPVRKRANQTLTKEAKAYLATVERCMTQFRAGNKEILAVHAALSKNPSLLTDTAWRGKALSACHTLKRGVEIVDTIHSTPDGARDLTQLLYSLASEGDSISGQYELGMNRNEIGALKFAVTNGGMTMFQANLEKVPVELAEVRSGYAKR